MQTGTGNMGNHRDSYLNFWKRFQQFIVAKGISAKYVKFYIMWSKRYVLFNNREIPPVMTNEDIRNFKDFLEGQDNTLPWQIDQALKSLTLFSNFLSLSRQHRSGKSSGPGSPALKDSEALNIHCDPATAEFLSRVKKEIRYLHYSIRTEQTYKQWIARFLAFHKGKAIDGLSASDIKKYLEYLAVHRTVSASTQNQALNAIVFFFKNILKKEAGDIGEFIREKKLSGCLLFYQEMR